MTQAVSVRRDGDAFQARVFWLKAARLLDPLSNVVKVGFESGPKGFDDVWVDYDLAASTSLQGLVPLGREHTQCKWHTAPYTYGYEQLIDPDFINANAVSLLQRGHRAFIGYSTPNSGARFRLLTNWRIERGDPLRDLVNESTHALRLERMFLGTDRSKMGKLRKLWRDHLGLDDDQLRQLAAALAFSETTESLEQQRDRLDDLFRIVGLRRVPANESTFLYDDLPFQWGSKGRLEFDRATFREVCNREGLLVAGPENGRKVFGVKSFEHKTDKLEDRCTAVLDLLPYFNERRIRPEADWAGTLYPALSSFLIDAAKASDRLRLILDAHLTLSFAAGSVLDIKSGRAVELEQRSISKEIWSADDRPIDPAWPEWSFTEESIAGAGAQIVVAVSLTHDTSAAVREFVTRRIPDAKTLLLASPVGAPGARAVTCGHHAFLLAEKLTAKIRSLRSPGIVAPAHLFIAAPGGFSFFLGQRHVALGPLSLYEFDFESAQDGSYELSLSLPIRSAG